MIGVVRTQAPMKRGLKQSHIHPRYWYLPSGPNPGPDEEGIETIVYTTNRSSSVCPNPGPDEEGIETFQGEPVPENIQ